MKKAVTFRLDVDVVGYLKSKPSQAGAVEKAIKNTKEYRIWDKKRRSVNSKSIKNVK